MGDANSAPLIRPDVIKETPALIGMETGKAERQVDDGLNDDRWRSRRHLPTNMRRYQGFN